jgi:hypothetical protein
MVDNTNPTSQFHPYAPVEAVPHAEQPPSSVLSGLLARAGLNRGSLGAFSDRFHKTDLRGPLGKVRDVARSRPALALGGLAVAAIAAGLMRRGPR